MNFIPSFLSILQGISPAMTQPTFRNFQILLKGWLFAKHRTITQMLIASGVAEKRHHSSFHRVFSKASWSLEQVGLYTLELAFQLLPSQVIFLCVDDTIAAKRGLKVYGVGMHRDNRLSSRKKNVTRWSHRWIVLSVLIRFPCLPEKVIALPFLFRLSLNQKASEKHQKTYRTKTEIALEMVRKVAKRYPNKNFHLLGDSDYSNQYMLRDLPKNVEMTGRIGMDARLYQPLAKTPQTKKRGPKSKRGALMDSPEELLKKPCHRVRHKLYAKETSFRYQECQGCWHHIPEKELKVVVVDPLEGGRPKSSFFSTKLDAEALQILEWYSWRWSIEVTFRDVKQELGFEEPPGWTRLSVERTAPTAMLLFSWVVIWFGCQGFEKLPPENRPWYQRCKAISFAKMLRTLRLEMVEHSFSEHPDRSGMFNNSHNALISLVHALL